MTYSLYQLLHQRKFVLIVGCIIVFGLLTGGLLFWVRTSASASGPHRYNLPILSKKACTATVTGKLVDAITTEPILDATVCYQSNCTTSNNDGDYALSGIKTGARTLHAEAAYYFGMDTDVPVGNCQSVVQNFALYPSQGGGTTGLRAVLTWSSNRQWPSSTIPGPCTPLNQFPNGYCPNDLDTHVWIISNAPGSSYHLDPFTNKGNCASYPSACIEADTIWGSGPETLHVIEEDVMYYYGVLNYYEGYDGVPPLSRSQARVRIFRFENGAWKLLGDLNAPSTGVGELWYVFTLNGITKDYAFPNCLTTKPPDPARVSRINCPNVHHPNESIPFRCGRCTG